ncbi:UNVERIFIED_CONTAM: hypothetical protein FKN15_007254 [Acipenser sinensis]
MHIRKDKPDSYRLKLNYSPYYIYIKKMLLLQKHYVAKPHLLANVHILISIRYFSGLEISTCLPPEV